MAHPFDFDWALPTAPEDVPLPPGLEEQLADIHSLHPRARALAGADEHFLQPRPVRR